MNLDDMQTDLILDRTISEINEETVDQAAVDAAADRVWAQLAKGPQPASVDRIRSCADFQALMPDYRGGRLSAARALLLEDHARECVACRKALAGEPARPAVVVMPEPRVWMSMPQARWAAAAAIVVTVGLGGWGGYRLWISSPVASQIALQALDGALYRFSDEGAAAVRVGEEWSAAVPVRTAKDSDAVLRLRDGSLVEMGERAEFSGSATRRDTTVRLDRGSIIVQAAKRRSGHLYVTTRDCKIAVTGTVFSVTSGIKGTRVSVVEGEVHVEQGGAEKVLRAGDQLVTSRGLEPVAIQQEVGWSRNAEQHLAMLGAVAAVGRRLEEIHFPELRYTSKLLGRVPENTAIYVSIPNLGQALNEAEQVLRDRAQMNPALRDWWNGNSGMESALQRARALSNYLGDEVVIYGGFDGKRLRSAVLMSEPKQPGSREAMTGEFARLFSGEPVRLVSDAASLASRPGRGPTVLARSDVVAFSPDSASLREAALALESTGGSRFAETPFGARLAESYRSGVGILLAIDLERVGRDDLRNPKTPPGIADLKYLVVEQKETAGKTDTRAALTFKGTRTGMPAWLARPAAMGTLDYISPEAGFAAAAVVKSPVVIVDEMFNWLGTVFPDFPPGLAEFESEVGFNIRSDVAAALGGEVAVALDGPMIPAPSWKLVVEVYDPGRLQSTIQKMVDAGGRDAAKQGRPVPKLTKEIASGRTYYTVSLAGGAPSAEVHYVFTDGYFVAAPNRALLDRAIQGRATGQTLSRSSGFMNLLPADHYLNFSALAYQNLPPALGSLLETLNPNSAGIQRQNPLADLKPTLLAAYGEDDRISFASTGSLLGLSLSNLSLGELLMRKKGGTQQASPAYRK